MTLKGNRTRIVAILGAAIPVLQSAGVFSIIPDGLKLPYAIGLCALMYYMRTITTTPIGQAK